jgi:hypothetical protein
MKAGTFNIQDYLDKLHEKVEEEQLKINEEKEPEAVKSTPEEGLIIPPETKKVYDWLKREFQRGKTEAKVEMSYHEFKPGYHLQDGKSTEDFPGMYGQVKTRDTKGEAPKPAPFPETKFPGDETKEKPDNKKDKNTGISVEAKTKDDNKRAEKKEEDKGEEKEEKKEEKKEKKEEKDEK